ncbi:hypothetical protein NDU88_007405 [Pleurodeles waltl]|uniref:Uncharacterized protein n=1 Tax=Pleurodeles waltl TaxID=8319 RepID=A0AAV7PQ41_PLEWA|nr:hypothetical protein NDU88_007405 [Pleurodeles waltl]
MHNALGFHTILFRFFLLMGAVESSRRGKNTQTSLSDRAAKRQKTGERTDEDRTKNSRGDRSLEQCDTPIRTGKHCEGTALQSDATLQCTRRALLYSDSLSPLGRNPTGGLTSTGIVKRSVDQGSTARGPLGRVTRPSSAQGGPPRLRKNSRGDRSLTRPTCTNEEALGGDRSSATRPSFAAAAFPLLACIWAL